MTAQYTLEELEAGERLFASPMRFLKSVPALEFLPAADRPEVAFAGRSNVGKSSLINAIARHRGLARASNTPGRTQELNYFEPAARGAYLVDMPGYGFAEAPKAKVEAWTMLVKDYLRGRPTLARVFLLIDARHGFKGTDTEILELLDTSAVSFQVVLTKADKVSAKALQAVTDSVSSAIEKHAAAYPVVLATSSEDGAGIEEVRAAIAAVLSAHGAVFG